MTFIKLEIIISLACDEAWLSLVERCVRDAEVVGSNPVASTARKKPGNIGFSGFFCILKCIQLGYSVIHALLEWALRDKAYGYEQAAKRIKNFRLPSILSLLTRSSEALASRVVQMMGVHHKKRGMNQRNSHIFN